MWGRAVGNAGYGVPVVLVGSIVLCACASPQEEPAVPSAPAVDHHVHIRSQALAAHQDEMGRVLGDAVPGNGSPATTIGARELLLALDSAGVGQGVVLSGAYMFGMPDVPVDDEYALVAAENDYVASQVALHPDRLTGFCSVNPLRDYAVRELERCGADARLSGLKLHLANSDLDLRNPDHISALEAVFRALERMEMPATVHLRTRHPEYGAHDVDLFIAEVLQPHPGVTVQIAHAAGWGGYDDATHGALGAFGAALSDGRLSRNRITFDLGAVIFQPEAAGDDTAMADKVRAANQDLATRIREIGVDRFVYATDWPSWPPVQDPAQGIAANVRLIRNVLPLGPEEMARLLSNRAFPEITPRP